MQNINFQQESKKNNFFRKVIFTGKNSQLVLMSLPSHQDIGKEVHKDTDQLIFVTQGTCLAEINDEKSVLRKNSGILIPAGSVHNITNVGRSDLKLFTIYAPPEHKPGTIVKTKKI